MPDYYELWSGRVAKKQKEMDGVVEAVHKGVSILSKDANLSKMMYAVTPGSDKGVSIGAVDGGEGLQELSGVAVYLVRASGFYKGKGAGTGKGVEKEEKKSQFLRDLDLGVIPVNRYTKARVQFLRAAMEYNMASQLILKLKPDYVMIDGSLLVGLEIDPIKIDEYDAYCDSIRRLFSLADKYGTKLVGVSEDSTSRGLIGYLSSKGLGKDASGALASLTDASLIQLYTHRTGEEEPVATRPFIPVSNKGRDWIKKNTGIDKSFPTFYLQATRMGRPLRVDFPSDGKEVLKQAEEIASLVSHLSQIPKRYGYPLPLYLAHSDAELPKKLMEKTAMLIQKQIFKKWGDEYLSMYVKKRRDSRPGDYET